MRASRSPWWGVCALAAGCATPAPAALDARGAGGPARQAPVPEVATASLTATVESPAPAAAAEAQAPPPAERFDASLPTEVPVTGDLLAQVAHGAVGNRKAIVYLHGVCGDIHKFRAWTEAGIHFGTVVAVLGDDKCKEPGRYKWGFGVERTDRRIVAALKAVAAVRGTPLDLDAITLVGYSQGSARAEALVKAFPERYRRAVLVAGPKEHAASSFHEALGVAMVGGQRDLKTHLQESAVRAAKAGVRARYFELPGARHGEYGADAVRVMGAALSWVFGEDVSLAAPGP